MDLVADCARCAGLCCIALPFAASADFALDKEAGVPCPNLGPDFSCGIHEELRPSGFPGCVVYDCFGAGQQVTQVLFDGRTWRSDPEIATSMFATFRSARPLHEVLWYLHEALALVAAEPVRADLQAAIDEIESLLQGSPDVVTAIDVGALRGEASTVLRQASDLARSAARGSQASDEGRDLAGADLFGTDLRGRDLRWTDLRGAVLVGADLRRADLRGASLLGADLRGADLGGADLTGALFVTSAQLTSARGDDATQVPVHLAAPAHW